MIISSVCPKCLQTYRLHVQASDAALVAQISECEGTICPCPRLCGGKINLTGISSLDLSKLKDPIILTGKQLFQAVNGIGLPDEIPTDELVIKALLNKAEIVSCVVELANGRFYLHEIALASGATLHLTAGSRGAMILKMTKERSDGIQHTG